MVVAETSSENPTVAIHRGFHMIIFCTPHSNIRRRRRRGIPRRVCSNQIVRKEHGEIWRKSIDWELREELNVDKERTPKKWADKEFLKNTTESIDLQMDLERGKNKS